MPSGRRRARRVSRHNHAKTAAMITRITTIREIPNCDDDGDLEELIIGSTLIDSFSGGVSVTVGGSAVVIRA